MSFGVPLGLLALAAAPLLVALYFLRRRSPPRTVSAVFLWRATEEVVEAGPRLRRLQRETSLVLELLAVLCATAFLADVRCDSRGASGTHLVVVVDGSLSMRALARDGRTFAARARERIAAQLDGRVTLVETGLHPRVLAGPFASADDAERALSKWIPSQPSHPFEPAFGLARELAAGGEVLFVTDTPLASSPPGLRVLAVGEPRPNVAFTAASRTDTASETRLRLHVTNAGDTEVTIPLKITDDQHNPVRADDLTLAAGATTALTITLPRRATLLATLPDDALPDDGRLLLLSNPVLPVHVRNTLDPKGFASEAVARVLRAASDVSVTEPASLAFGEPAETVPPWTITVGARGPAEIRKTFVGPFFQDHQSALLDDVQLDGAVWTAGTNPPGKALVSAGDRVLVSEVEGPAFHLNIDLARSNVQRSAAWPILLANLVDLRRAALPGFTRRNTSFTDPLTLDIERTGAFRLRGDVLDRPLLPGVQKIGPLAPGTYELLRGDDVLDRVSVLALDEAESDLRKCGSVSQAFEAPSRHAGPLPTPRSPLPLALMLAALLADWLLAVPGPRRAFGRGRA